jgi:Cys-rich repeat protein
VPENGYVKITGKIDLDNCSAGTLIVDFDPHIDVDWLDGRRVYQLSCRARIKTAEIKNVCPPSDPAGVDAGGGHACDMARPPKCTDNAQCANGMVCSAGQCIPDPCQGVSCAITEVCRAGQCVPDPCAGVSCAPGQSCVNGSCQ